MTGRVLFYVQHLLGVGHLKRAELLAAGMADAGLAVTVVLGGTPLPEAPFRAVRTAQLPPASIANEDFSVLVDAAGAPVDDAWKAHRAARLRDIYRDVRPDVVLIELFPFGRRQFRFELLPLLETIHAEAKRPRVACSLRDILVASKKPGREAEVTGVLRRFFDAVLVHGDPALIPLEATFPAAHEIADLIRYTGYVAAPPSAETTSEGRDEVVVSAGGGAVGAPLLFAALAARPLTELRDRVWRFIAGPNLPAADYRRLAASADHNTVVEHFRADFPALLKGAALSISQAGYNTTMDILRADVPALVIPYETGGETEQRLRSEILARRGILALVPADELSPQRLAAGIAAASAMPRPPAIGFDLSGTSTTARLIAELAGNRSTSLAVMSR